MLTKKEINKIKRIYYFRTPSDIFERIWGKLKECIFGFDCSIFYKTIEYYLKNKNKKISCSEALKKALNKEVHKKAWFAKKRETTEEVMDFYKEVDVYPFRQPYLKRFNEFRWYRHLVNHFKNPSILEYGCGSAVLTEWLSEKFPECQYSVADIPSTTLDFIKWKKKFYKYDYEILEIGAGKEGIPLKKNYDLIICQDVLEHTPNPLEIVQSFCEHLNKDGILLIDFIDWVEGENLFESQKQREDVKKYLKDNLYSIKAIDEPRGNGGIYLKNDVGL
jgi:SAM-dependent methyltransferase